ncbi:MAG: DUF4435 domain-containing protein [Microscillaceae bacterium]|jgi:hypothetical protein|nr:DUF4435 domain-containing protein [Microscillaceae bacterium]
MKYDLSDILVEAIKNNEPVVIVEGKDDRQIYYKLTQSINPNIQIYQVNEFDDYGAGCENVIDAITKLQPKFAERADNIKYILGIIDKDSRPYRGTMPDQLQGIFVTKFYSIEAYFATGCISNLLPITLSFGEGRVRQKKRVNLKCALATRKNLANLIAKITYQSPHNITSEILDFVEKNINNSIENLYYISLEALKNACVESYLTALSYDENATRVSEKAGQEYLINQILPKKAELEQFAIDKTITIQDIRHITKGKWFLYNYVYRAYHHIQQLADKCKNIEITQCASCKVGNYEDCLYKLKKGNYPIENLYDDILEFVDFDEMSDIVDVIKRLGNQ